MALRVDPARITWIRAIPWEFGTDYFGVVYKLDDGTKGADPIGSKQQAAELVRLIHGAPSLVPDGG
jgi:hypothetical protein